ncbi:MAG: hypothetical protein ACLQBX_06080 [Candidatus Limnocylindrales bacterium]
MPNYVAAMDLGSIRDYTTLAIVENLALAPDAPWHGPAGWEPTPKVRKVLLHLKRWPLELAYAVAIEQAAEVLSRPPWAGSTTLLYDRTGLGTAVMYQFREAHREGLFDRAPKGLAITGGDDAGPGSVPKVELVDNLRALVETGKLTWPADLPLLEDFLREMAAFAPRPTRVRRLLTFGNKADLAPNDDLVSAVALAVWHPGRRSDARAVGRDGVVYASIEYARTVGGAKAWY